MSTRDLALQHIRAVGGVCADPPAGALSSWQQRLQRLDRALVDAAPWVGRYCWETVVVLER